MRVDDTGKRRQLLKSGKFGYNQKDRFTEPADGGRPLQNPSQTVRGSGEQPVGAGCKFKYF